MNTSTRELKQLRADLDVLITLANQVLDGRETRLSFTNLEEGKMHIGNTLFELQQAHLYQESMNPSNNNIDPYHIDKEITPLATPEDWNAGSIIQNIKIMRRELDGILVRAKMLLLSKDFLEIIETHKFGILFLSEAIVRLRTSQNWFGMALGKIRESSPATAQ